MLSLSLTDYLAHSDCGPKPAQDSMIASTIQIQEEIYFTRRVNLISCRSWVVVVVAGAGAASKDQVLLTAMN